MKRLQWAPLNAGVFLIILAVMILLAIPQVGGLTFVTAIPLIFAVFGVWLVVAGLILPPDNNPYGAPRTMVLGWGALIAALGLLWFVGAVNLGLLPIAFVVILLVAGIGAVGYSLIKSESKNPSPATA